MKTVRQILQAKGYDVWGVDPDSTVYDALKLMAEKNVGALLVLRGGLLIGIFSERDYARKMILKGKHSKDTLVREVMTEKPICVVPGKTIEECMSLMTENHIRHLPVMEADALLGVISIGDVVKGIIVEQQGTISDLEDYITGRR
ncbi:MAG: CBS domain-containing protein [Acidobacteriia bacterium]|nr:CBS domain-containing protein [Terriglobia bacterium]